MDTYAPDIEKVLISSEDIQAKLAEMNQLIDIKAACVGDDHAL